MADRKQLHTAVTLASDELAGGAYDANFAKFPAKRP